MKNLSSLSKLMIAAAAFTVATVLFFAFGGGRVLSKPKLEADPVLDAQLGAQQVALPKGVVSVMCTPSLKESAKQVTGKQPDNLPNGFTCTVMLAGQKLATPWATYAGEGQTMNGESAMPPIRVVVTRPGGRHPELDPKRLHEVSRAHTRHRDNQRIGT